MKYFVFSLAFVFAALIAQAQTTNPTLYTYKQKKLNDTLQMLFPDLRPSMDVSVENNMPVILLKNEGVKVGINSLGEIYSMNVDKMPFLKPFKIQDEIPNARKVKPVLPVVPPKAREEKKK